MSTRTKEARIYTPIYAPETCDRTANGLTVTNVVLQGKYDQCRGKDCEAQFIEARESNINITAVINNINHNANKLPTLFSREINKTPEGTPRRSHHERANNAFQSVLGELSLGETDGIALAYERPVNRTSQLFLALGKNTLAFVTGKDRYGKLVTTYYQPQEEMDSHGFYIPRNIRIPQGATLILATGLEQFPPHTGDVVAQAYARANDIMKVLQKDFAATANRPNIKAEEVATTQQEVIAAYLSLGFEPIINEHLLTAIDALRFNPDFQQRIQEGNSEAIIAKIIANDLCTLQKDALGNPTLQHNVAVITSQIS